VGVGVGGTPHWPKAQGKGLDGGFDGHVLGVGRSHGVQPGRELLMLRPKAQAASSVACGAINKICSTEALWLDCF
jgi:hypothetical protein